MTLDEAIAREKQLEKEQRSHIGTWDDEYSKKCEVYAEEHEQLAEWLEELKAYQQQHISLCEKHDVNTVEDLYVKAIDDFVENVKDTLITDYSVFNTDDIRIFIDIIEELAEQLKAGEIE